jgi:hypothetical protein
MLQTIEADLRQLLAAGKDKARGGGILVAPPRAIGSPKNMGTAISMGVVVGSTTRAMVDIYGDAVGLHEEQKTTS